MCLQKKFSENSVGKGKIARNEQFLLFPQCFLPVWRTFFHFHQIWNYCPQTLSVWKSPNFVIRERVNHFSLWCISCWEITFQSRWLVVLGFNATVTAKVISWWSVTHMFPGFLTPVLIQLFFPKPPTTFLTCFCRGERRKYARKKSHLNLASNSQPPGHKSDTLTTEPPGQVQSRK